MFYPEEIIEDVRRKNDIVDVIGASVRLKRSGSNYQGLCPFHNEKTPSFSVNPQRQIFKCFGCGKGGNVLTFVMEYENIGFPEALKFLADRAGVKLPQADYSEAATKSAQERAGLLDMYKKAAIYFHNTLKRPEGAEGYKYLKGRGLSDETIIRFGLGFSPARGTNLYKTFKECGYSPDMIKKTELFSFDEKDGARDKFWNRVMFPILDVNGKVIAFGGRVMGDALPKYLNSNETRIFEKSKNLYAMNISRKTKEDYMLLCEGYMDVIALHQAGFDNAVASLGTSLTPLQANLIARYTKNVYITYDSDGAGVKAALRAIPILKNAGITAKVVNMEPYKDPDEFIKNLGKEEYEKRINNAVPGFFFRVKQTAKAYDFSNPEEKTKFYNEAARMCLEFEDEIERNTHIEAFCREYAVPTESFNKLVNRLAAGIDIDKTLYLSQREPIVRQNQEIDKYNKERLECEKLVFTWSSLDKRYAYVLKKYAEVDNFQEGIPRKIAEEQYRRNDNGLKMISPASLINLFETTGEQAFVSELFQADMWEQINDEKVRDKAFADSLCKILLLSSKDMSKQPGLSSEKLIQAMKLKNNIKQINSLVLKELEKLK